MGSGHHVYVQDEAGTGSARSFFGFGDHVGQLARELRAYNVRLKGRPLTKRRILDAIKDEESVYDWRWFTEPPRHEALRAELHALMRKADDAGVSPHVFDEWVRERRA